MFFFYYKKNSFKNSFAFFFKKIGKKDVQSLSKVIPLALSYKF